MTPIYKARVPATSANLGPGFDTLGMALQLYNTFYAHGATSMAVEVSPNTCVDISNLTLDTAHNLLAKAYQAYFTWRGTPLLYAKLLIEGHIPLSRGLGSSSTAIVGGVVLANAMHSDPLPKAELAEMVTQLEGHPDNVIPALLGGVQCCISVTQRITLTWPPYWGMLFIVPPQPLSTQAAREIMPQTYAQSDVIETLQGMAAWIYGLQNQDWAFFKTALQRDKVHEPYRGALIPQYKALQDFCESNPNTACVISGSGSTLALFCNQRDDIKALKTQLTQNPALADCRILSLQPDQTGAVVTEVTSYGTSGSSINRESACTTFHDAGV